MKKLRQYQLTFYGPHSKQLFEAVYTRPPSAFTDIFIGVGKSKAQAAERALSYVLEAGWSSAFYQLEEVVKNVLPSHANEIEGDALCSIYCVLALEAEDV